MNKFLRTTLVPVLVTVLFLFSLVAQAIEAPYPKWLESGLPERHVEPLVGAPSGGQTGFKRLTSFVYDTAIHGGTATAHGLGVYLPAKAVIVRSFFKIITQFSDSGTGTVALSCEDANNIKTATDITGSSANAFVEGASTGTAATFVRGIAARCEITATVATVTQDAGKLVGWVEWLIED